jgi:hypothetical protein
MHTEFSMKITSRLLAAFAFLCTFSQLGASPLLFVNYNLNQTTFAQARAGSLGLEFDTIADFTSASALTGKSVVVMPGFSTYAHLLNQGSILHDFVQAGGYLWLNVAGSTCASDVAPGGVDFAQYTCGGTFNQAETIDDTAHPYIQGDFHPQAKQLASANFVNWNVTDLGHLTGLPGNATTITRNPLGATLAEYAYGQGWVVVSTLTYGWGDDGAKADPMDNMLLYAANQVRGDSSPAAVATPEPATMLFTGAGLLFGMTFVRRRK